MAKISSMMKVATRALLVVMVLLLAFGTYSFAQERQYSDQAWSFGVMGDTQWTQGWPFPNAFGVPVCDAANPNCVAVSIINQLNSEFIDKNVKFVIQLGDLTDWDGDAGIASRADAAAALYNEGIGFFPMRGNHETYGSFFVPFGLPDLDPDKAFSIPSIQTYFPQTRDISDTFGAHNFSSPSFSDLDGISYSFDYNNSRFVIVDPLETHTASIPFPALHMNWGHPFGEQQDWISERLDKNHRGTDHAFVMSHQPLLAQNHADTPFAGYADADIEGQNAFFASLRDNGVKYYLSAHDHLFSRSMVASPDGSSVVEQLISSPACPKFYPAVAPDNAIWAGQKYRQTPMSEEFNNIGYYIYTVDGPRVNVEYWADQTGNWKSSDFKNEVVDADGNVIVPSFTPHFTFVKKENWGYSLNGQQFLIGHGESFTAVQDTFGETTAKILAGALSVAQDSTGRPLSKSVNTGWTAKSSDKLKSDILSLWGMANLGTEQTDTYVLSMSFDFREMVHLGNGGIGIATVDSQGNWINAVSMNFGGTKKFVVGPYKDKYGLGTYGVDPSTKTAWAVINYNADFAVANDIEPVPGKR